MANWSADYYYFIPLPEDVNDPYKGVHEHTRRLLSALKFPEASVDHWRLEGLRLHEFGLAINGTGKHRIPCSFGDDFWRVADTGIVVQHSVDDIHIITVKSEVVDEQAPRWRELTYHEGDDPTEIPETIGYFFRAWPGRTPREAAALSGYWKFFNETFAGEASEVWFKDAVAELRAKVKS